MNSFGERIYSKDCPIDNMVEMVGSTVKCTILCGSWKHHYAISRE